MKRWNGQGPRRHVVQVDEEETDPRTGMRYCGLCHLAEGHPIHEMPMADEERAALERRRMGERG